MSNRVLCKFFAHGACLKGEHCEFSHDWKDPPNNICTYYQRGACSYGSRCRYEHVRVSRSRTSTASSSSSSRQAFALDSGPLAHPSSTASTVVTSTPSVSSDVLALSGPLFPPTKPAWSQESPHHDFFENGDPVESLESLSIRPSDKPICSFAAAGNCPRGEKCPHVHGELCPSCGKHCLHPFRPEEREEHVRTCEKKQKHLESLKHSQEIECSVCLERVLSKPTPAERKFGLLSECDHPFCITCIRNWRNSSPTSGMDVNTALRACPICRKLSYFVIPSVIWYTTKEEKQEIVDSYKAKLRSINCKYFDFGNGACPFGTSCFYKHTVKPGSYIWIHHKPPPRRRPRGSRHRPNHRHRVDMTAVYMLLDHLDRIETELGEDFNDDIIYEVLTPREVELFLTQLGLDTNEDYTPGDILDLLVDLASGSGFGFS